MLPRRQTNQYDKIFRENIEAALPSLMKNLLGIEAVEMEELPDDIQHTKERKPDFLKRITNTQGEIFVLQIEFQVVDEPTMIYRMLDYYAMLTRKYLLPIEQYVIFLGQKKPQMPSQLEQKTLSYHYNLINIAAIDYRVFVNSIKPEEILLGILANFAQQEPQEVIRQIIRRIEETANGDFALKRYRQQLRVLSQLRQLEILTDTIMLTVSEFFKEEKDPLYMRGIKKGEEVAQQEVVRNLLRNTDFSSSKIAQIVGVSEAFVENLKVKK